MFFLTGFLCPKILSLFCEKLHLFKKLNSLILRHLGVWNFTFIQMCIWYFFKISVCGRVYIMQGSKHVATGKSGKLIFIKHLWF